MKLAFLFLLLSGSWAETENKGNALVIEAYVAKGLFRYELGTNDGVQVTRTPLPNRVHIRYEPKFSDWVFVLSDTFGRFAKPAEVLVEGSVLDGTLIGGIYGERYEFASGGGWVRTEKPLKKRLVVLDEVPRLKVIDYEPLQDRRIEFVNPDFAYNPEGYDPIARR